MTKFSYYFEAYLKNDESVRTSICVRTDYPIWSKIGNERMKDESQWENYRKNPYEFIYKQDIHEVLRELKFNPIIVSLLAVNDQLKEACQTNQKDVIIRLTTKETFENDHKDDDLDKYIFTYGYKNENVYVDKTCIEAGILERNNMKKIGEEDYSIRVDDHRITMSKYKNWIDTWRLTVYTEDNVVVASIDISTVQHFNMVMEIIKCNFVLS